MISIIPSACCILGVGNPIVTCIVIIGYVITTICYRTYLIWSSYNNLNSKSWGSRSVNMDFQTFKNLYDLNSNRFEYTCRYWEYHIPWSEEEKMNKYCRVGNNFYSITSPYKDTMYILITNPKEFAKYYKWNKQRLKQKAKKKD